MIMKLVSIDFIIFITNIISLNDFIAKLIGSLSMKFIK